MISQLEDTDSGHGGILTFNPDYLDWVQTQDLQKTHRPWGLGRLYDSSNTNTIEGKVENLG